MNESAVLQTFRETQALLDGHFQLRSGLHSRQFFQCALVLQHPRIAEQLCAALTDRLRELNAQVVISPAMGGLFVGHEVGRALGVRHIFAEKNATGALELRRNFQIEPNERVLVVEDVITRGGRVQETIDIVKQRGGNVVGVGVLVDRSGGRANFGVPTHSLLRLEIETFEAASCPMCHEGSRPVKPGS